MKLYVPEIGDHLRLAEDWEFNLHGEERNQDLGEFFGYYLKSYNDEWVEEAILPRMRPTDYEVKYPLENDLRGVSYDRRQALYKEAEANCPEYVKYWDDYKKWKEEADKISKKEIRVSLPAGTILAVDRIYIRKGISEFSSITFYAKGLGEVIRQGSRWNRDAKPKKKKSLRFWAKLEDCNRINFEKYEN